MMQRSKSASARRASATLGICLWSVLAAASAVGAGATSILPWGSSNVGAAAIRGTSGSASTGNAWEDEASALEVAERLVAAFNRGDAEAMASLVTVDFELFYVGTDGQAVIGAEGRASFLEQMEQYFACYPGVRSSMEAVVPGPTFVAYRERIIEGPGAGQSSIAVFEVRNGKLRRAWYYPTESDESRGSE